VAPLVVYLAQDDCTFSTGAPFFADGGELSGVAWPWRCAAAPAGRPHISGSTLFDRPRRPCGAAGGLPRADPALILDLPW